MTRRRAAGGRSRRPHGRRSPGRVRSLPGVAVVVLLVAGCGVRVDAPPPSLPSPSHAETVRQAAAQRVTHVLALAETAQAAPVDAPVLDRVAEDARRHLAALGGLWAPPDWATTSPTAAASPSATADEGATTSGPPPSAGDVGRVLAASAEATCTDAITAGPGDLATLLASICLAQRASAEELGATPGALLDPAASTDERRELLASALAETPELRRLALALDTAGFALEVAAARAEPTAAGTLKVRAARHRSDAELLLRVSGWSGTPADPRRAAYGLSEGPVDAAEVEEAVLAAWTAVLGDVVGDAREAVLQAMSEAAVAARASGSAPDPLPGLVA